MMLLTEHHGCLDIKFKQLINQQNKADNQQRLSVRGIERQFQKSIKRAAVFNYRTVSFLLRCFALYEAQLTAFLLE